MSKRISYEIVVAGSGVPYERIAGPFDSRAAAEKYASQNEDPQEKGRTIEEMLDGGGYRISAIKG